MTKWLFICAVTAGNCAPVAADQLISGIKPDLLNELMDQDKFLAELDVRTTSEAVENSDTQLLLCKDYGLAVGRLQTIGILLNAFYHFEKFALPLPLKTICGSKTLEIQNLAAVRSSIEDLRNQIQEFKTSLNGFEFADSEPISEMKAEIFKALKMQEKSRAALQSHMNDLNLQNNETLIGLCNDIGLFSGSMQVIGSLFRDFYWINVPLFNDSLRSEVNMDVGMYPCWNFARPIPELRDLKIFGGPRPALMVSRNR